MLGACERETQRARNPTCTVAQACRLLRLLRPLAACGPCAPYTTMALDAKSLQVSNHRWGHSQSRERIGCLRRCQEPVSGSPFVSLSFCVFFVPLPPTCWPVSPIGAHYPSQSPVDGAWEPGAAHWDVLTIHCRSDHGLVSGVSWGDWEVCRTLQRGPCVSQRSSEQLLPVDTQSPCRP